MLNMKYSQHNLTLKKCLLIETLLNLYLNFYEILFKIIICNYLLPRSIILIFEMHSNLENK